MSEQSNEAILRRYLLADVDEVERERIEERLFCDNGFAEELGLAESELIDDYALKVLSERDRGLFEQNFVLSEERGKNLLFGQTLGAFVDQANDPVSHSRWQQWQSWLRALLNSPRAWVMVTRAAAVLLFVLPVVVVLIWFRADKFIAPMRFQREKMELRLAELNREPLSSTSVPSFQLSLFSSTLLRGGGDFKQIEITGPGILNISFELPKAQHSKYIVIARKSDGDALFSVNDLVAKDDVVLLRIPSEFLPSDDYQFELKRIDIANNTSSVAIYNLRVSNTVSRLRLE